MWNATNYPPSGGPFAQGGWAPSSGPPPPPGMAAGGFGFGGPPGGGYASAYNVNQYPGHQQPGYGGYQMGQAAPPMAPGYYGGSPYGVPQGGAMGQMAGAMGGGMSGAVPGFTTPAVHQCQQQYGGRQGPPQRMQAPPSMQYNNASQQYNNQSLMNAQWANYKKMGLLQDDPEDEEFERQMRAKQRARRRKMMEMEDEADDEYDEEQKRQLEERAKRAEEKARELQERLAQDDSLKEQVKDNFINELMRRQQVNGTFEETGGTVYPFVEYDAEDPVAKWHAEVKESPIEGEKWDPLYDAEYMRKAVKGLGTDEAAIIAVVSTRCNSQRNRILTEYKTAYGRDLKEDLRGDLSGNFEEIILGLFETPARYDAWSIKKAIYGLGTDEKTLIEILMTRTNAQIQETVSEYDKITYSKQRDPGSSIERDVKGDTSGDFKRLLISACQGNRRLIEREVLADALEEVCHDGKWIGMFQVNYHKLCNVNKCKRMAQELFDAGEDRWGTDEETFNRIFSTQDYYTLRVIWDEYVKISQRDIMNSVDRETSGDYKAGLRAIAQSIKCRPMYFAQRLHDSMKGLGTKDSALIRTVISRSEIDMVQIKRCFLECYGQTVYNFIKDDTSGDYRRILLALVGKN